MTRRPLHTLHIGGIPLGKTPRPSAPSLSAEGRRMRRQVDLAAQLPTVERCDGCGAETHQLTREEVEGIVCERCPDCRERGGVP